MSQPANTVETLGLVDEVSKKVKISYRRTHTVYDLSALTDSHTHTLSQLSALTSAFEFLNSLVRFRYYPSMNAPSDGYDLPVVTGTRKLDAVGHYARFLNRPQIAGPVVLDNGHARLGIHHCSI